MKVNTNVVDREQCTGTVHLLFPFSTSTSCALKYCYCLRIGATTLFSIVVQVSDFYISANREVTSN